jgi:hypothetical protein
MTGIAVRMLNRLAKTVQRAATAITRLDRAVRKHQRRRLRGEAQR